MTSSNGPLNRPAQNLPLEKLKKVKPAQLHVIQETIRMDLSQLIREQLKSKESNAVATKTVVLGYHLYEVPYQTHLCNVSLLSNALTLPSLSNDFKILI